MPDLEDPRIARATAAMPDGAPDPEAFRYEPEYETLASEVGKLERTGPASVQWPEVVVRAQEILAARSKDLSVATWLAVALERAEGLAGLAVGLAIVRKIVETFWDRLVPKRSRARIAALEWLSARAAQALPEVFTPELGAAPDAALAELEALDALLREKLPDANAALGTLVRPLRNLVQGGAHAREAAEQRKAAKAVPTAPAPAAPTAAPATASASTEVIELSVAGLAPERAFSAVREAVRTAALALMEGNLGDARAYRLLRAITWLDVTELPPVREGRTALLAPPEVRLHEFEALRSAGNHKDLVLALERFCSGSGLFWLDGQRLAAAALGSLGPSYAACAEAIVAGVGAGLKRLSGLGALVFTDGTPFANGATRAWIETVVLPQPSGERREIDRAPWQAALRDARRKMAGGDAKAALALLRDGAASAPSDRARFCWRLGAAKLCLESGSAVVALPLLQHLATVGDAHELDAWEPDLVAEAALLLYRCASSPDIAKIVSAEQRLEIMRSTLARIARADPVLAIEAAGTGHG